MQLYAILQKKRTENIIKQRNENSGNNQEYNAADRFARQNYRYAYWHPDDCATKHRDKHADKGKAGKHHSAVYAEYDKYYIGKHGLDNGDHDIAQKQILDNVHEFFYKGCQVFFFYREVIQHKG